MRILLAFMLAGLGHALSAQSVPLHVEIVLPKRMLFTGETARCIVRVCFDQEYVGEHLLPIVQRRTALPFLLKTSFSDASMPDLQWLPATQPASGPTLAMDDDVVTATPAPALLRDGKRLAVIEIERRFRIKKAGRVVFPGVRLLHASTTGFDVDFLGSRTPRDRKDGEVLAAAVELEVLPPPSLGRPAEFRGAVGAFGLNARADKDSAHVGEVVLLTIELVGAGIAEDFTPPTLGASSAFHLLGTRVERATERMTLIHELRVLDSTAGALPVCALVSFDPDAEPPGYRRFVTPPVPIQLLAASVPLVVDEPTRHVASAIAPGIAPLPTGDGAPQDAPHPPPPWMALACLAVPWGVAAGVGMKRLIALRRARDDGRRAARRAAHVATRALARNADPGATFITYLAARLRLAPALVLGPELRSRLHEAAVPAELAVRVQRMVEAALAGRWGDAQPPARTPVTTLIAAMEEALPPPEQAP